MKHHLPALPSDYFFASSPDLLATASSAAILSTTNPAWTKTLGFAPAELSGKKLIELFPKCDHKAATTALKAAVTSQSETTFSGHCRCQDGTFRYIDWSFYGKEDVLYLRGRDNTKRRQETAAFERSLDQLRRAGAQITEIALPQTGELAEVNATGGFSALCGAPHKADYVDRTIMWTILSGLCWIACAVRIFGD